MDPKHLAQLATIIDLGSMSRAAERLNITQPTLTRTVRIIEDRVGSLVLRRGRYGVMPTKIGERLAEEGRAILKRTTVAEEAIDLWRMGLTEELIVGVGPALATSIMGGFFARSLENKWPYSTRVVIASAADLIAQINDDQIDLALAPSWINMHHQKLVQELLFEDELAIFAGSHSRFASTSKILEPADLSGSSWVATGALSGIQGSTKEILNLMGLQHDITPLSLSGDIVMATKILDQSDALCILPKKLTKRIVSGKKLHELKVNFDFPRRNISLWMPFAKQDLPSIVHFRTGLRQYLDDIGMLKA